MSWIDKIQELVDEGVMKNIQYNRLILNKDNFSKINIRKIIYDEITIDIIESCNDKNYLLDTNKCQWKNDNAIEASLFLQGVIQEVKLII